MGNITHLFLLRPLGLLCLALGEKYIPFYVKDLTQNIVPLQFGRSLTLYISANFRPEKNEFFDNCYNFSPL
jgi:hypothetical protein